MFVYVYNVCVCTCVCAYVFVGGVYPTVVPGQAGPYPQLTEFVCNPAIMPCSTAGDWGRAIGMPLRHYVTNTGLYRAVGAVSETLNKQEVITHTLNFVCMCVSLGA